MESVLWKAGAWLWWQDHQEQHQSEMERALQAPGLAESLCAVSNHQYTSHRHKDYSIKVQRPQGNRVSRPQIVWNAAAPYTLLIASTYIAYNSQVLFRLRFCCYSRRFLAGVQFGNFDRRRMRSSKIIFDPWRCGTVARCHGTTSGAVSSVSSQQILQFLRQLLIWLLMVLYPPIIIM